MPRSTIFIFFITCMQKIIIILILFLIGSCTYLPESTGQVNEIIVLVSEQDKILIEPLLSDVFSHVIHTPQIEQTFILRYRDPWELENYKEYGNIILASLTYPADSTADILLKRILAKHNQDSELLLLGDLYATNQLFCIIHGLDAISFENILSRNREWILEEYHTLFQKKIFGQVFKHGKNNELSNEILQILGHTIELQPDFKLIRSDSLHSFVWVGRGYPYRWITLHMSRKDSFINIQSSWKQLQNDLAMHMPEITISKYFKKNEKISYGKKQIPVMRGIYEHSESDSGGPFFVYIFDTEQINAVILISGFVNYPGHEKLLLIKELEIMAKTLYKGDPA